MTNFIIRRLIQTVVVIALLSYFCFYLMTLMPGDPVELMIQSNPKITSEDVVRLRTLYGLDQPVYTRYANWAKTILTGDLGYSRTYRIPVSDILGPKLFNTFVLSIVSLFFSLLIAIPLGVWAALNAGKKGDYIIGFFAFGGISMPSFWFGLVLIILFAVWLPWFPASGTSTIGLEDAGFWASIVDRSKYLVLPVLTLTYISVGRFLRFTRSAMLEAMRNDYIRTAKAKGLSRGMVIWQHGFRNALLSLITMVTLSFSGVFSGAAITETVFAYQGVGKLVYDSVIANDFNVAMVSFMISVSMVLIFNLLADILYSFADPRISLS
jgi:peptide/nickel transport system permease protein